MRWSKSNTIIALTVLLVLSAGLPAQAHQIADGNVRTEIVHEPTYPPAVEKVTAYLYDANPAIRTSSGWSWAAVSMTDPQLGDCHNGSTNPTQLRALRLGWFKNQTMLAPKTIVAWITYNNTIQIRTDWGDYTDTALAIEIDTSNGAQHYWNFKKNGQLIKIVYDGPNVRLKCLTFGGWASSSQNAIGNARFENVAHALYGNPAYVYYDGNPVHSVRHSSYTIDSVVYWGWNYLFYGNN